MDQLALLDSPEYQVPQARPALEGALARRDPQVRSECQEIVARLVESVSLESLETRDQLDGLGKEAVLDRSVIRDR